MELMDGKFPETAYVKIATVDDIVRTHGECEE